MSPAAMKSFARSTIALVLLRRGVRPWLADRHDTGIIESALVKRAVKRVHDVFQALAGSDIGGSRADSPDPEIPVLPA